MFKQWYKPLREASTPILNRKHLVYIATKIKEAVYNPGCGFCLWGNLKGTPKNIDDFQLAKKTITEVSHRRTIYRCVVSLSHEDATEKGFYSRENWQRVVSKNMEAIAKEMYIKPDDFKWVASFHYKHGHPHCHLMYWDNGTDIRQEHIPEDRFEIMSEKVRAAFNRDIFSDELMALQTIKKEASKEIQKEFREDLSDFREFTSGEVEDLRKELNNLIFDLKPSEAINITGVGKRELLGISKQLLFVSSILPDKGSLKYKYLSGDIKKEIDKLSEFILSSSAYSARFKRYIKAVEEISRQYGNGEKSVKHNVEKAYEELLKDVGNQVLRFIKNNELIPKRDDTSIRQLEGFRDNLLSAIQYYIKTDAKACQQFAKLRELFPDRMTPAHIYMTDEYKKVMKDFTSTIAEDEQIQDFINKFSTLYKATVNATEPKREIPATGRDAYSEVFRFMRYTITEQLKEEKQWQEQYEIQLASSLLISCTKLFSNRGSNNPQQHKTRLRSKDKSKEQRKAIAVQRANAGENWEMEI